MADLAFSVCVPGGELAGIQSGAGYPLLVLHGGPGLNDYSSMFAAELAGWRALRYTQRGAPPSTTSGPFTVGQHVRDALAVLDHHQVGSAVVLGHSWGGYLAMQLAAAAPERASALVLVDTLGGTGDGGFTRFGANLEARTSAATLARVGELAELARAQSGTPQAEATQLESLRLMWPSYFPDPSAAPPPPANLRIGMDCYQGTLESVTAAQAEGKLPGRLSDYAGPVEVVAGAVSPFPVDVAESTAAMFGAAHLTVVRGAGHFTWSDRPGCVAAALRRIAARITAPA